MDKIAREKLIAAIDKFQSVTFSTDSTLGKHALNDGKAVARIRAGGRLWPETEAKLRAWMRKHPNFRGRAAKKR
jgi:hypothetical protein